MGFSTICLVLWCSKHITCIINIVLKINQIWGFLNADTITLFYKEGICACKR